MYTDKIHLRQGKACSTELAEVPMRRSRIRNREWS